MKWYTTYFTNIGHPSIEVAQVFINSNLLRRRLCGCSKTFGCWWAHVHCPFLKSKRDVETWNWHFKLNFFENALFSPSFSFSPFSCFLYFIWIFKILHSFFIIFLNLFFLLRKFSLFFLLFKFLFFPFLIYFHFVPSRMWSHFYVFKKILKKEF